MTMPDLENAIKGLECCTSPSPSYCRQCPYKGKPDDYPHCVHDRLQPDALALLKQQAQDLTDIHADLQESIADNLRLQELVNAQEPRVMTLAEALTADYVYLEIKLHASLPCECCILAIDPDGGILPLKKGFAGYLDGEEYGETWRCWTSRPTDEKREATPWTT